MSPIFDRTRRRLKSILYAISITIIAWLFVTSVIQGWILPIWRNPLGFVQGVYCVALVVYAVVAFLKIDERYAAKWCRVGLWERSVHVITAFAAPALIFAVGTFLFKGLWPAGAAFSI